ncbi:MAG: hybrid sensor histidine kinase/response regulator [Sulfuricella sp.]|nr:hybrid sensor histidine kinase/response regulator [Sulfuricella sp.]
MNYNLRFLVVDDMDSMRRVIAKNLNQMGFKNIVMAANGTEGLHILRSQPVQVVITDWNMPVMSGLEMLKAIRADAKLANLPVLMVTAETQRHQVEMAIEAGVSDFMVKPFTVNSLETKLTKIINTPRPEVAAAKAAAFPFVAGGAAKPAPSAAAPRTAAQSVPEFQPPGIAARPIAVPPMKAGAEPLAIVMDDEFKGRLAREATILVVDDVPDNLDLLVELLDDEYRVKAANGGERALKILESGKLPDLILLDVMMPEMDGFEVCRRLKANPATADIPVIFLTAMGGEAVNVTQGLELGAVDYISKPADPPILKARIRTHLRLKRSFDEIRRNHEELQKQHAILEENFRLREEVERIVHHDMKNPIGGIINFSSILLDDDMMSNDQKEIIKDIEQSAYSVLNMVNLSLDLYKMEQGTYAFTPGRVDIAQLLKRIVKEKQSELEARQVSVQFMASGKEVSEQEAFFIAGDELLCYSLFGNLFKNAMEASGQQQTIKIDLHGKEDRAMISLVNHGAVPLGIREHFFDKFVTAGKQGGTGLGTYSAKLIAETQCGRIAMNVSDENNTTTLMVMLPRAAEEAGDVLVQ